MQPVEPRFEAGADGPRRDGPGGRLPEHGRVDGQRHDDGAAFGPRRVQPFDGRLGVGDVRLTEQETSQPSRVTIEYWASGLEPIYFEGAFARAQGKLP